MTTQDFLARLQTVKRNGHGFMARCPAHEDHTPSLSVAEGTDGAVLVKCFAGCSTEEIVQALGLDVKDLFPDPGTQPTPTAFRPVIRSGEEPEARYAYRSAEGVLLAEKLRYKPKRFAWRRPDGQGGWLSSRGEGRMPLYRIDEIRARGSHRLAITEGEKDCDRVWSIGWPATTTADGAGKWYPEYVTQLKAAAVEQVVVFPDNDEPGRQHAEIIASSCHDAGIGVKVVPLPDVPDKGDISDYLDEHDKADLVTLVREAQEWRPSTGVKLTWLHTVEPQSVDWLWSGRLARGKVSALAGDPGNGKSFLSCDVAARLSRGLSWPDGGDAPKGRVLMLSAEDDKADTIRPRIDALGGDTTQIAILEAVIDAGEERLFSLDRDVKRLTTLLKQEHFDLVIIDPVTAYLGKVDSHKDADVRRVLAPLFHAIEERRACLLMILHLNKNQASSALYRVGGSIALVAAARIGLVLGRDPDDQERRILAPLKCNLSAPPASLAYRFDPAQGGLIWESAPVDLDAESVLAPRIGNADNADAEDWLQSYLEDGPVDSKQVFDAGSREGYARSAVNRAKKKLGVKPRKIGFGPAARWVWNLPTPSEDTREYL